MHYSIDLMSSSYFFLVITERGDQVVPLMWHEFDRLHLSSLSKGTGPIFYTIILLQRESILLLRGACFLSRERGGVNSTSGKGEDYFSVFFRIEIVLLQQNRISQAFLKLNFSRFVNKVG